MDISLRGLKAILKRFDENGRYAEGTHWSIANGGYDLWWELYYDNMAIARCVAGTLEITVDELTDVMEKRLIKSIKSVYTDLR